MRAARPARRHSYLPDASVSKPIARSEFKALRIIDYDRTSHNFHVVYVPASACIRVVGVKIEAKLDRQSRVTTQINGIKRPAATRTGKGGRKIHPIAAVGADLH